MRIIVNGQPERTDAEVTVGALIEQHNLQPLRVAVEVNEQLVRRCDFENTQLRDDDRVEIVTFVGGG